MSRKMPPFLVRMSLAELLRLAHRRAGEELADHALARAVGELLEVEIEHRLSHGHANNGYAKASPLAFAGEGGWHAPGQSDRVADAADRYRGANAWRGLALDLLEPLKEGSRRAALVCAFMIPPTKAARRSPRMMTAPEACRPETLVKVYQQLGYPPRPEPAFADAKALNSAASYARKRMREALEKRLAAVEPDTPHRLTLEAMRHETRRPVPRTARVRDLPRRPLVR